MFYVIYPKFEYFQEKLKILDICWENLEFFLGILKKKMEILEMFGKLRLLMSEIGGKL